MKLMRKAVAILLIETLAFSPVIEAVAQEQLTQEPETGKVVVVSEKVGETIDLEERNYYKIFLFSENFQSAVLLQLPDSSFVAVITEEKEGIRNLRNLKINKETMDQLREHIDNFENLTTPAKDKIYTPEDFRKARIKIKEARRQVKILAKEKWTKERWQEEILNDRGRSYRSGGAMFGFTIGAVAGMLIGKGIQGKKVEREVYHEGAWDDPGWTEEFYSYEHKHAPHHGAVIGGISGAIVGYWLGKKADKKYYILVPKNIRMEEVKVSGFINLLFGLVIVGPIMGGIAGSTLYAPESSEEGKDFGAGVGKFLVGYLSGTITGTIMMAAFTRRSKHKKLWEESLLEEEHNSSVNIQFMPSDQSAFTILHRKLPSGETFCEYRMDMIRLSF